MDFKLIKELNEDDDFEPRVQTKTKSPLDDLFKSKTNPLSKPNKSTAPTLNKASKLNTLDKTSNINLPDEANDLLRNMKHMPTSDTDEYRPVEVTTSTLPAVITKELYRSGVQSPDFHQVANLPGNMRRAIMSLGKALFASFTATPTQDIWMIGNVAGQGPNTKQEVNAVANWIRETGDDLGPGNVDFDDIMPGYQAEIRQYDASGTRWLLVKDKFGEYIYSWPEQDSVHRSPATGIDVDKKNLR